MIRSILVSITLVLAACGGDGAEGDVECSGAECVCPGTGDCLVDCTADCDLQCAGSGSCDFLCGADCDVACTGSGACVVTVGDGGFVACPGSGGCDVVCDGDCDVECPGSGECLVQCAPGAICSLSRCSPVSCPNDIDVCNGPCP